MVFDGERTKESVTKKTGESGQYLQLPLNMAANPFASTGQTNRVDLSGQQGGMSAVHADADKSFGIAPVLPVLVNVSDEATVPTDPLADSSATALQQALGVGNTVVHTPISVDSPSPASVEVAGDLLDAEAAKEAEEAEDSEDANEYGFT